jgi:hypothetical protein
VETNPPRNTLLETHSDEFGASTGSAARIALIVENLFLRKQPALFQERDTIPRRTTRSIRVAMIALATFFEWRNAAGCITIIAWKRRQLRGDIFFADHRSAV